MKPIFLCTLLLLLPRLSAHSQNFQVYGALNSNTYYAPRNLDSHYRTNFEKDEGYMIGISADSLLNRWPSFRFDVHFEQYGGKLMMAYEGLGGGHTIEGIFHKSVLSICASPINFNIGGKMFFHIGLEYAHLLKETHSGTSSGWRYGNTHYSTDLQDRGAISQPMVIGLRVQTEFRIRISPLFQVVPTLQYYYGISSEFNELEAPARSRRVNVGIGFGRSL